MARQVQIIKGTTAQNEAFTGAEGALSYDSQKKNLHVHDGATEGGFEIPSSAMADYVIYWDSGDATDHSHAKPGVATPASGTWYRLYKSGWVEQGGFGSGADSKNIYVSLPIEMSDVNYTPIITTIRNTNPNSGDGQNTVRTISTTGFVATSGVGDSATISWQVSGCAAPAEYTKDKWD